MIKLDMLFAETVVLDLTELTYISDYASQIKTKYWLDSLSILNLGEAAKQIFVTLLELRHLNCDQQTRLDLLNGIVPAITQLNCALQKQYIHQSILETRRDQQVAQLVLEIQALCALIFCDIFNRGNPSSAPWQLQKFNIIRNRSAKKRQALAGLLALNALTTLMHGLHSLYLDVPKKFWLTAYTIYAAAQAAHIHRNSLSLRNTQLETTTIENAFKQLLLLQILNTHKLSDIESKNLMHCIPYWLELLSIEHRASAESKYLLNYAADKAPVPILNPSAHRSASAFIQLEALKHYITASIGNRIQYQSPQEEQNLTTALKFHVLSILDDSNIRKNTRYEETGELDILFGLSSAHYYLSKCTKFIDSLQLPELTYTQALQLQNLHAGNEKLPSFLYSQPAQHAFDSFESHGIDRINIVNRSAGGFCLQWSNTATSHLRTGSFIMTRNDQYDSWSGGIIRWIKSIDHKNVQLGIESFGKHMMCAVAVKMLDAGPKQMYQPAIILTGVDNDYSIILQSSQIYYEQQKLILRLAQEEIHIVLKAGRVLTSNCARFNFELQDPSKLNTLKYIIEYKAYNDNDHPLREFFQ